MSILKTTLLSHIFNEEHLLPFWLNHHKNMFDEIIIVDYNSTDKSIEICKSICPNCVILNSRNEYFGAIDIDKEIMDIENETEGIKIVLNTTEFLLCETSVKDIFIDVTSPISYSINCISPYSKKAYNINNCYELFSNLLNNDIVYHYDRGFRQIHTFPNGNYHCGRHGTYNHSVQTNKAYIIWFGYYPMSNDLLKRKLQIQQKIPQSDKDSRLGFQHLYDINELYRINQEKSNTGVSLKDNNLHLYNLLTSYITKLSIT
jgi:hypothetical protein